MRNHYSYITPYPSPSVKIYLTKDRKRTMRSVDILGSGARGHVAESVTGAAKKVAFGEHMVTLSLKY